MTLRRLRSKRSAQGPSPAERRQIRSLLGKASRGNVHAFTQAVSSYTKLIFEYLYLCGYDDRIGRTFLLKQILSDCWRYLPYTRRVSDFERFLQVRLEKIPDRPEKSFPELHEAISTLSHEGRFLLVARILNDWSNKSIRLALRTNKAEVSQSLLRLRCKLTGVDVEKLTWVEQAQVLRVSELLEGGYSSKDCRKIEKEIGGHFHAHKFKADWLAYRCELVDLQLEISLTAVEQAELAEDFANQLKSQPMEKPRLYDSIVNQFTFIRLPLF